MGTSTSVPQFVAKLEKAADVIGDTNRRAINAAALDAKNTAIKVAAPDTGGDMRLSRWRSGKGIRLSAGYEVSATGSVVTARVHPRPIGVWKLLEHGAAPHPIVPGATRRRRKASRTLLAGVAGPVLPGETAAGLRRGKAAGRVLSFGPGQVAAYVMHPGTSGKSTWSNAAKAAKPVAVTTYQRTQRAALVNAFR